MTREEFVRARQDDWNRFEALLSFTEGKRSPKWSGEDVSEFSSLFRAICYDLSLARSRDFGLTLNRYLNNLVGRGHNAFYHAPPGAFRQLIRFFTHEFPWLLRKHAGYFWVALALFVLPGLATGILLANKPELGNRLFTQELMAQYKKMHSGGAGSAVPDYEGGDTETRPSTEVEYLQPDRESQSWAMTGLYIHNNIGIAFKCFASGALLGLGSMCFLVYNSLFLGGITGYLVAVGNAKPFFTFAISHGSFELTAIVVAGAAGLVLGRGIVHPGQYTRRESFRRRGLIAVKLALGAGGMLAVAALIEGFWSPSQAPSVLKICVGVVLWFMVIGYLWLAGRDYDPLENVAEGVA